MIERCKVKKTTTQFIQDSVLIHGNNYDYSLVDYTSTHSKIPIICKIHGVFNITPNCHLSKKQGCPVCGKERSRLSRVKPLEQFIQEANIVHNNKYDYSLAEYTRTNDKINIICPIHGIFNQLPMNHLKRVGCPRCKISKGETAIINWLSLYNIPFIREYRVIELGQRKFDFYLSDFNTIIEFDGIQHYYPYDKFGGIEGFNKTIESDNIKTQYCLNNNIKLIRIPYWKINVIHNILLEGLLYDTNN